METDKFDIYKKSPSPLTKINIFFSNYKKYMAAKESIYEKSKGRGEIVVSYFNRKK